jgi:hypothetical protein
VEKVVHIFFSCALAMFMWAGVQEMLGARGTRSQGFSPFYSAFWQSETLVVDLLHSIMLGLTEYGKQAYN